MSEGSADEFLCMAASEAQRVNIVHRSLYIRACAPILLGVSKGIRGSQVMLVNQIIILERRAALEIKVAPATHYTRTRKASHACKK